MPREMVWDFRSYLPIIWKKVIFQPQLLTVHQLLVLDLPHRDQHLHSLMSTVNKKPVIVIQELILPGVIALQ